MAAVLVAAIGFTLASTAPVFAKGHAGAGGGTGMGMANVTASGLPGGFSHGNKHGWHGASTPPGWSHGKKKGWGTGTRPPGLASR